MANESYFEPTPFTTQGQWVKAGFHCHTAHSDGEMTPEQVVERYRSLGYRCLAVTDHRRVTPTEPFSAEDFIGINGTENGGEPDVLGVGVTETAPPELPLAERATALARQGGFTILAHPTYSAVLPDAALACDDLMAIEIYNAYCDEAYTNGYATELWDMLLGQGMRIRGVASDDAHLNTEKRYYSDAGHGWVEIWAEEFTREAVLAALKRGAFYSTQGPHFESITVEGPTIRLTCDPVGQVRWRTFGKVGSVEYAPEGGALTESRLPEPLAARGYVRIEIVGHDHRRAWSNPFFIQAVSMTGGERTRGRRLAQG